MARTLLIYIEDVKKLNSKYSEVIYTIAQALRENSMRDAEFLTFSRSEALNFKS